MDEFLTSEGPGARGAPGGGDVVNGRYQLPDPVTGQPASWTRATNFAETLADQYGLTQWKIYQVLRGLRRRPDLVARVQVLDEEDRSALREVTDEALSAAASQAKANVGTAIHDALALLDRGQDVPEPFRPWAAAYQRELERCGLTVVPGMVEFRVCNRDREAVGTGDRMLRTADGRLVVGDVKTGRLDHSELAFGIQVATYAEARWFWAEGAGWVPVDTLGEVDLTEAVLLYVDPEHASAAAYRVDLAQSRRFANLATEVRRARRYRGLLTPYVPPLAAPATSAVAAATTAPVGGPASPAAAPAFASLPLSSTPPDPDEAAVLAADQKRHLAAVPDPAPPVTPEFLSEAELMRLSKAQLQQYCRDHGVTDDLAHQKSKLVDRLRRSGQVRAAGTVAAAGRATTPAPQTVAPPPPPPHGVGDGLAAGFTAPPPPPPPPTGDPADPRDQAFSRLYLARIRTAATINELGSVYDAVRREGGDRAWTEELDTAAKQRAREIEPPAEPGPSDSVGAALAEIAAAPHTEELAAIWDRYTVGGTQPERWSGAVLEAAQARLAQLQAAPKPAAVNPFVTPGVTQ